MKMLKIIIPHHKEISTPVKSYEEIKDVAQEMIVLLEAGGFEGPYPEAYAMTHSQVAHDPKTFFVMNHKQDGVKKLFKHQIIINPVIVEHSEEIIMNLEACLSLPYQGLTKRHRFKKIKVTYWIPGLFGRLKKRTEVCEGLKGYCIQHECDHFVGKY